MLGLGVYAAYRSCKDALAGMKLSAESGWYLTGHKLPGTKLMSQLFVKNLN